MRTEVFGHGYERHGFLGSDHCPLLLELARGAAPSAAGTRDDGGSGAAPPSEHTVAAGDSAAPIPH